MLIDGCGITPATSRLQLDRTLPPRPPPTSLMTHEGLPEKAEMNLPPSFPEQTDSMEARGPDGDIGVALLTGAQDRSYALGLASSLLTRGISVDFIGSDTVNCPELDNNPLINFLNLRGDQSEDASLLKKVLRISAYYVQLLKYAVVAKPRIFHILWNNKLELFDRTILTFYYWILRRKIVLTVHNVNAAKRDGRDSISNRFSLHFHYMFSDHIFVHTEQMKNQICTDFKLSESKVNIIPFGINETLPTTDISRAASRNYLGVSYNEMIILFFGQIAPYKGLDYLLQSIPYLIERKVYFRIVIAGKVKSGNDTYWNNIESIIRNLDIRNYLIIRSEHIPDDEVEIYFKASDVLVLPYTDIYQSGLPFLAYSFGLPVIATDVGSLREDILEGLTGYVCKPRDPADLAKAIEFYFHSSMYSNLASIRPNIQQYARERYSWTKVAAITAAVYRALLER